MKVISFCATKGGTGKTSLCFDTAVHVSKKHSVLLADLDPQRSLRGLWERRAELINPRLVTNIESMAQSLKLMKEAGLDRDYMFVDTPGSMMPIIRDAISVSDLVCFPVQPSQIDLDALEEMIDLAMSMKMIDRCVFIINRTNPSSDLAKRAEAKLQSLTYNPIVHIPQRTAYMRGAEEGKAGCEIDKKALGDITNLWKVMSKILSNSKKPVKEAENVRRLH